MTQTRRIEPIAWDTAIQDVRQERNRATREQQQEAARKMADLMRRTRARRYE